jgi:uncharacterized phage protein gp47/JayE
VNAITALLIERPYPEVVDDILTALVGGVVNEPIVFDVKSDVYPLAASAQAIRGITGTITNPTTSQDEHHSFQPRIDFAFDTVKNAVVWQDRGVKPKDETIFYVNYYRPNSRSPITDTNVGGVARTLCEAVGREIATVYQQINLAYQSGFVDTATGKSLDFVVSILGVARKTQDFAVGSVTFFRNLTDPNQGNITIPQGASLSTTDGSVTFQTTEPRTLHIGEARIDVPIRADDAFKGDKGIVAAGTITALAQGIDGIDHVSNIDPTARAAGDETDDDLRLRAKAVLRGLGKGTIAALAQAIFDNRAKLTDIFDPNGLQGNASEPGTVKLQVDTEAARFLGVQSAVNEVRAAGVATTVVGHFILFKPRIVAKITPGLTGPGKDKIKTNVIATIEQFIDQLPAGSPVAGTDLLSLITKGDTQKNIQKVADVQDIRFVDVQTASASVGTTAEVALVDQILTAVQAVNVRDSDALRAAISDALSASAQPADFTSAASRKLVEGRGDDGKSLGTPATDAQIELGNFIVAPPAQFSISLDMQAADILLQES